MDATYLRVKNQAAFQHYDPRKRRPPWIKAYTALLGGDDRFMQLGELEQWQLFRIWLVAAGSTSLTLDEDGVVVPVVANDAVTLQRAIMSAKRVPLAKFIRDGWLIPVAEDELLLPGQDASAADSKPPVKARRNASAKLAPPIEVEVSEEPELLGSYPGRHYTNRESLPETINPENELLILRLMADIGDHADQGDHGFPPTAQVVRSFAAKLPPASVVKVIESLELNHPANRARYAVDALRDELAERTAA